MKADTGTRDIPRSIHAFAGQFKSDLRTFLSVVYPAIMSGALVAEGQQRKMQHPVTQAELAPIAGLKHRPSFTRRVSRVCSPVEGWDSDSRKAHADRIYQAAVERHFGHQKICDACCTGAPCEEEVRLRKLIRQPRSDRRDARHTAILRRQRRYGRANRMGFAGLPERTEGWAIKDALTGEILRTFFSSKRAGEECERMQATTHRRLQVEAYALDEKSWHAPTLEQLLENEQFKTWFNDNFSLEGYKATSCWIWDPKLMDPDDPTAPLGAIERLVMSAYEHFGLMEEFKDESGCVSKAKGFLQIHQVKIARYLGISVKSVYNANCKWAKLGVLRIASDEREEVSNGHWVSKAQKVIYLPTRMLTEEEAQIEQVRMRSQVEAVIRKESAQRRAQLEEAQRIHDELLKAWTGHEHCLRAFWKEVARRIKAAGVDSDLIVKTVPHYHPSE